VFGIVRLLKRLEHTLNCVHEDVKRILRLLALKRINFIQLGGRHMPISGITAGKNGTFVAILTPPNGAEAPGSVPAWKASDSAVILVPSADGLSCEAAVPVGFTAASFDLEISAVSSDAAIGSLSQTHTIPVTQPPPPPPPALTTIDFDQTA
jgi:hypothetical protein